MKNFLILSSICFFAACTVRQAEWFSQSMVVADGVTTIVGFETGHSEANPLMPKSAHGAIVVTAVELAGNHCVGRLLGRKDSSYARVWFLSFGSVKGAVAAHNVKVLVF